jgi:hypothetical protein
MPNALASWPIDGGRAVEGGDDPITAGAIVGRFPAAVGHCIRDLGVVDTGGGGGRHEFNDGVPDRHLHRFRGAAVEDRAVDNSADDDAALHEPSDRVADVHVVATETVHPTDDQDVVGAQDIEQAFAVVAFTQLGGDAGRAFIGNHLVDLEAIA